MPEKGRFICRGLVGLFFAKAAAVDLIARIQNLREGPVAESLLIESVASYHFVNQYNDRTGTRTARAKAMHRHKVVHLH